jgi:hypothetical protein
MKLRQFLLVGSAALALTCAASAQTPAPGPGNRAVPPNRIAALVRAAGFDPLFRPVLQGDTYVVRALDRNALEYRLVIDAYTGRTISAHMTGERGSPPGYGGPVFGRIFGPTDGPYDDRVRYRGPPPREAPRPLPPQTAKVTPPAEPKDAAPSPQSTQAPLPRPRPYVMEATSSIPVDAPKPAEPEKTPPPTPAPQAPAAAAAPAEAPHDNGGGAMPPVVPLD